MVIANRVNQRKQPFESPFWFLPSDENHSVYHQIKRLSAPEVWFGITATLIFH